MEFLADYLELPRPMLVAQDHPDGNLQLIIENHQGLLNTQKKGFASVPASRNCLSMGNLVAQYYLMKLLLTVKSRRELVE